jgi:hypothetical protein
VVGYFLVDGVSGLCVIFLVVGNESGFQVADGMNKRPSNSRNRDGSVETRLLMLVVMKLSGKKLAARYS